AAAQSCVLLKNGNQTLPLKKSGTIALIGPLANNKNNMLGTWAPTGDPQLSVPVFEGLKNVAGDEVQIRYAKGANISDDTTLAKNSNVFGPRVEIDERLPEEMLYEAVRVANQSDVIVAVVGEASEFSGESASRTNLLLPESQKKLVRALAKTGKPLVLVMMSGRPLALVEENELADAILQTWHPGVEAGNAIADVLFGDYNPSGKLTATFPRKVGQVPIYYAHRFTGRPQEGNEFQKFKSNYLDVENSPLFPFGYGLSYADFEYTNLEISKNELTMNNELEVSVDVRNTGDYDGAEVVQMYVRDVVASVTPPVRELKGFEKVFIPKGETKTVTFTITSEDLAFYNFNMEYKAEPGKFVVFVGGNSNAENSVEFTLTE
ncbi:MAG TPA: glycoside hydrolase family 3 C-terminal domain-containing protein, partial [Prolixibacteraceae bacterium]|nr:glycoside hydrolase family 3 C-terminal domain-containing protein [Prolixibacteraceae bacterium]